jgi:predicted MFS family arabinose efflux permease
VRPVRISAPSVGTALVAVAIGVAFADSSIVVLALPQLLGEFDTSITGVSWVITAYNLVVAVVALAFGRRLARESARRVALAGLVVFLAGSLACAAAGSLEVLVALRCVQGVGAALLLTAALPILVALTGSERRGTGVWIAAGALGAAIGPALGGVLTEAFDWRAIFIVQAPLAALAIPAVLATSTPRAAPTTERAGRVAVIADIGLALVFAALAGALFLVVVLLVDVWRMSPIEAAAAVTALPVATFAGGRLERRLVGVPAAVTGALTLAAGLLGLALLPATSVALVVWALALCGAGLGLALPFFATRSLEGRDLARSAARSVGARHAGLVLALVLIAPVLAHSVDTATDDAALGGAAAVLDAPVGIADKVQVALALDKTISATPNGQMPDVAKAFEGRSGDDVDDLKGELVDTLEGVLTRAFRSSFGLTAAFALLACVPAYALRRRA